MFIIVKLVFALLGLSVGTGVYQLITSPWGEQDKKEDDKSISNEIASVDGVLRKE